MGRQREFDIDSALDRAMEVFWRHGYSGAPIQDVCAAMQLKPGSVYATFGSKHELFLSVVERYLDKVNRPGLELLEGNPCGLDGVRDYLDYVAEGIVTGKRRWGCLGTNAFVELSENDAKVTGVMAEHLARLEAAFRNAMERDGIPDSHDKAKFLLCAAQGLNVVAKARPDRETLDRIIAITLTAVQAPSAE